MYSWLRDALIPGVSAVLESLWAYAWISMMLASNAGTASVRYSYLWILALILAPACIGRALDFSTTISPRLRQHGLTALVLGLFVGFMVPYHAAGAAWLAAAVLLARGVWLAMGDITSESAAVWFLLGFGAFLALLAILLFARPAGWEWDQRLLGPEIAAYLFAGLCWLALVRRQDMEERTFRRAHNQLHGAWLALLAGISAAMIGVVATASFAGKGLLMAVLEFVGAAVTLIWRAALYVVANWIGPALVWLFSHLPQGTGARPLGGLFGRKPPVDLDARLLAWLQVHLPVEVLMAMVLTMLLGLLAIWLAYRYRWWMRGAEDEERTSLWSWRLFLVQLREALRHLGRSLVPGHSAPRPTAEAKPDANLSSMRQLYAAVLDWCRQRDLFRPPAQTPNEFEAALQVELGGSLARDLTAGYVRARYGEEELDADRVDSLCQRWAARRDDGQASVSLSYAGDGGAQGGA